MTKLQFTYSILLCFILFTFSYAQQGSRYYKYIDLPDKTAEIETHAILQDSRGFMWFGTTHGLHRFDGVDFKAYRSNRSNQHTLSDDEIYELMEDQLGNIWIGTKSGGLNILDPVTDQITRLLSNPEDSTSIAANFIKAIFQDKKGTIWIGSLGGGLSKFLPETNSFKNYRLEKENESGIGNNYVTKIIEDGYGYLWLGFNGGGVDKFDPVNEHFQHYRFNQLDDPAANFRNNVIREMYDDGKGNIWMATFGGFNKLEKATGKYSHFDIENNDFLKSNSLNSIVNREGRLIVTSYDGYIYEFNSLIQKFVAVEKLEKNIRSSYNDNEGSLWVGLTKGELLVISKDQEFSFFKAPNNSVRVSAILKNKEEIHFGTLFSGVYSNKTNQQIGEDLISDINIMALERGNDNTIWIGTDSEGLNIFNPKKRENKIYRAIPGNAKGLGHDTVLKIYKDQFEEMWVCTSASLSQWMPDTQSFLNRGNIRFNDVIRLNKEEIWCGTSLGVAVINLTTDKFYMKQAGEGQQKDSLIHNQVNVLYTPDNDSIFIGTKRGLNIFVKSKHKMVDVHQELGLPYTAIKAITQDHHKNYWMITGEGILNIDLNKRKFKYYDKSNGLNYNNGWNKALLFDKENSKILLGGNGGYYSFTPKPLTFDTKPILTVITEVKLFNEPISSPEKLKALNDIAYLDLPYNQNMISFTFAGLNFINPSKVKYAYQMEGLSDQWIYSDDRTTTFTNLDPGGYTFRVKATNNDGIWNETPIAVSLEINPPFWATWWAYLIYFLLLILMAYLIIRVFVVRERLKASLRLEHMEVEKMQEVNEMKSRFFANISHEFRTPLTLITGPANDLLEQPTINNLKAKKSLRIIQRNSQRLKRLINQLLDFSKLEASKLTVHKKEQELFGFLRAIGSSFSSLAEKKEISYTVDVPITTAVVLIDDEKIEMVVYNLISNALKFTSTGGNVTVKARIDESNPRPQLIIGVEDTGPGIDDREKNKVFDRFYRSDEKHAGGTGIGLALTKELVELMDGSIKVEGEKGKGSIFEVELPIEMVRHEKMVDDLNWTTTNSRVLENKEEITPKKSDLNTILLVEDNEDLRNYIGDILRAECHLIKAVDGEQGLNIASKEIPDLIISDLMMPKMEGDELCRRIKSDEKTSHIPFIMLTAKASNEDKLAGLSHGANDYLTKPFDRRELRLKVKNILNQRESLQKKLQRDLLAYPQPEIISSQEDRFIFKLRELIMNNLGESKLNVNFLSSEMGLSRVQLYRKVRALIGLSTSDFIRKMRVHKAAELIKGKWGSISEIAYEVGFNNLSYFTKCFKETYGETPSYYSKY